MLSIIIPTLNEEKYLPLLLEAIKKQNFNEDFEIIVADAGSEDKTVEIAKNCGCKIVPGGLPARGRNEGARVAQGEKFLFMDADNIYLPENFLKQLIEEFEKRNLDVASFPIYPASISDLPLEVQNEIDKNGGGVYPNGNWFDKIAYGIYNFWAEISQNFLPHATNSILVRKKIHQTNGGFDEEIKIGEDHAYARKSAKIGKFGFIETKPVLTSTRRFERDGRVKTYLKYLIAGAHLFLFGKIKSDIYNYRFNKYSKNKKNEV